MIPSALLRTVWLAVLIGLPLIAADPALRILGVTGTDGSQAKPAALTLEELRAMPRVKAKVRMRDGEHTFEGVALAEVLKRAGQPQGEALRGRGLSRFVLITAHDGYRAVFSLPELDPAFTDSEALLADTLDGGPLPVPSGPLRLILPKEKREARWIRMVEQIEILASPDPVR